MQLISVLLPLLTIAGTVHGAPAVAPGCTPSSQDASTARFIVKGVDATALVPDFGVTTGAQKDVLQGGSCGGFNVNTDKPVPIPCNCPPDRAQFLAKLTDAINAGNVLGTPVNFNTDASDQRADTNRERATACIILLQSFTGVKGVGCPAVSAPNFLAQQKSGVRYDKLFVQ
jgi:hypothetical protein